MNMLKTRFEYVWAVCCFILVIIPQLHAVEYEHIKDIRYYTGYSEDPSVINHHDCRLDLYYPKNIRNFPTVIWLQGGGLTDGARELPAQLLGKEAAIVSVTYRKYPAIKYPAYIEDAAAALNWAFKNIKQYGGDENKLILAGYSAGAYLALMLGLDKKYTGKYGVDVDKLASVVSISGQAITHFTVRTERGIPYWRATIDEAAPIYHVRNDATKLILVVGGREEDMYRRYDENRYLEGMLKLVGHPDTHLYSVDKADHTQILPHGMDYLVQELNRIKTNVQHIPENKLFDVKVVGNELVVDIADDDEHDVGVYLLEGKELFRNRSVRKRAIIPVSKKGIVLIKVDDLTVKYWVE